MVWKASPSTIDYLIDGESVLTETVTPESNDASFRHIAEIPITQDTGFHKLTVQLQVHAGEVSPQNNQLSAWFKVKKDGIQVLYLDTAIRPEYKFLRRFLETREGITATAKSPFWLRTAAGKAFVSELDIPSYDVFILGDLQLDTLTPATWQALHNVVRNRGAGLLIAAGPYTIAPGAWTANPVEPALPIKVHSGKPVVDTFSLVVPHDAREHFLSKPLVVDKPSPIESLTMLGLRNMGVRPRPTTDIIFADTAGQPLLGVDTYYNGRCAMLATDALWNWSVESPDTRALYEQFWTRMIYWLAKREDGLNAKLSIMLGKNRVPIGTNVAVSGDLLDSQNTPVTDASVRLRMRDLDAEDGTESLMFFTNGRYGATLRPSAPGHYSLQAETEIDGGHADE